MRVTDFASNLRPGDDGIWRVPNLSAVSYPEDFNQLCYQLEDESFWFRHRNRCLIEALRRFPPDGAFFDIGGGNGCVAAAVQANGWPVALIEPGPVGARNARRRGLRNVINATLEDAGFRPGCLPAAGAFDVVEHIQDDLAFVRSIARALRPGGRFFVTVPAMRMLWSQEDEDAGHYRRYSASGLRKLLEAAGLRVEYATHLFRWLPLPILFGRALRYRLGIRFSASRMEGVYHAQHKAGRLQAMVDALLANDVEAIRRQRAIRFGSSLLAVARRSVV